LEKIGLDFSLFIAYLAPGSIIVITLAQYSEKIGLLLLGDHGGPTGAALAAASILALALGIVVNAITWFSIRRLIIWTGVEVVAIPERPSFETYKFIIENSFRYYQCYSNLLTALLIFGICHIQIKGRAGLLVGMIVFVVCGVLFAAARDSFKRTYTRIDDWLVKNRSSA
jgi:hypothetical protein